MTDCESVINSLKNLKPKALIVTVPEGLNALLKALDGFRSAIVLAPKDEANAAEAIKTVVREVKVFTCNCTDHGQIIVIASG